MDLIEIPQSVPTRDVVEGILIQKGLDARFRDQWTERFMQEQNALITCDPAMIALKQDLAIAAVAEVSEEIRRMTTSMILGETGTGKEHCAKILHGKRVGPFVSKNMAAIPDGLFEVEMFGAARGAYTGADTKKVGAFVAAENGTLFLDEIGELSGFLQTKLLRALESREVTPLGQQVPVRFNCQIVSATNKDIHTAVRNNQFRSDLFWRLSILEFNTIPLRERRCDVAPILHAFRMKHTLSHDDELPDVEVYAEGNVRALIAWAIRKELGRV